MLPFFRRLSLLALLFAASAACTQAGPVRAPDAITADGAQYYGPLVDGRRQGQGRLEWPNGAHYEGGFDKGLYAGAGLLKSASGFVYEGGFENGMMSGRGTLKSPDGSVYTGEFRDDAFNGKGRLQTANGDVYEGMFKNGQPNGEGSHTGRNGVYRGMFGNGRYSGPGEFVSADGSRYRGEFADDALTGKGSYTLANGAHYEGGLKDWRAQGSGKYTDANGNVYEGEFKNGDLSGPGKMTAKSGDVYTGEFRRWLYHGKGVFRYANGDEYKGAFANGLYEGEGTLIYAQPKEDGRTRDSGTWHYGELDDPQAQRLTRQNVETALYSQRALLDKAIAALPPRDPGKINLYLLAVAGDGGQEVFRREVEYVTHEFGRDFGLAGRSLALINSRSTTATAPMATVTSIRESLNAIAAKMDRDKDILLLFLTSHGTREHEFVLDQNGIDLRYLEPGELAAMLRQSGIKWKAVIVSACYSGGFIDDLKDDHTLIITAARRDRTSFGCADENDFTYFGRAFFKESLPKSASFEDAFARASRLIGEWENEDIEEAGKEAGEETRGKMHSLPQMVSPAPVKKYLREWWAQARGK